MPPRGPEDDEDHCCHVVSDLIHDVAAVEALICAVIPNHAQLPALRARAARAEAAFPVLTPALALAVAFFFHWPHRSPLARRVRAIAAEKRLLVLYDAALLRIASGPRPAPRSGGGRVWVAEDLASWNPVGTDAELGGEPQVLETTLRLVRGVPSRVRQVPTRRLLVVDDPHGAVIDMTAVMDGFRPCGVLMLGTSVRLVDKGDVTVMTVLDQDDHEEEETITHDAETIPGAVQHDTFTGEELRRKRCYKRLTDALLACPSELRGKEIAALKAQLEATPAPGGAEGAQLWARMGVWLEKLDGTVNVGGRAYDAVVAYARSLELDGSDSAVWVRLGRLLKDRQQAVRVSDRSYAASGAFCAGFDANPVDAYALFELGLILESKQPSDTVCLQGRDAHSGDVHTLLLHIGRAELCAELFARHENCADDVIKAFGWPEAERNRTLGSMSLLKEKPS